MYKDKLKYGIIVVTFLLFFLVGGLSIISIFNMSGNARVVNYAGIVRGGSQKLIKQELTSAYTKDMTKQDDKLIEMLDGIIYGLSYGKAIDSERDFSLIMLKDDTFMEDMSKIREYWEKIKIEINNVRNGEDPQTLYDMSQDYFQLCDRTVGDGEKYSERVVKQEILVLIIVNIILLASIIAAVLSVILSEKSKKRAEVLQKENESAKQESHAKSTYLANMSHEIRTPLNVIIGMANVANRTDDHMRIKHSITEIIHSSEHLLDVVNEVLDISKIEAGFFELVQEPFHLMNTINEILDMVSERCNEKGVRIEKLVNDDADTWIIGDKKRIKQVLINLLSNSIKFTPSGKVIRLIVQADRKGDKLTTRFCVEDSGIGMTREQISRIFQKFQQADSNIVAKYGGTGLGLAISKDIVNNMGGDIFVESDYGKGSQFSFTIVFDITKENKDEEIVYDFPDLTGKRIMLVDDVNVNCFIITMLLEDTGAKIEEAKDGSAAVELFANSSLNYFDLILMDTRMPVTDGYDATKKIRSMSREDAKTIPIISMSANAFKDEIEEAMASGMNDKLIKPIEINNLSYILVKYLT